MKRLVRMRKREWWVPAALFAITLASRLPFRTGMLYEWDSVLYAQALNGFDVRFFHPQPPGHLFYVGLVWLVNQLVRDPNAAMVWVSVFASAAAVAALYRLGEVMFGRRTGLIAAVMLATSLSFWAHSEVALPYTLLGLLSIIVATLVFKAWQGNTAFLFPAAAAYGIASGFREDLLIFLMPIFLLALWRKPVWKIAIAACIVILTVLCWVVPAALLSGGFSEYRNVSALQSAYLMKNASLLGVNGFAGIITNTWTLLKFTAWALSGALALLAAAAFAAIRVREVFRDRRYLFLFFWAAPCVLINLYMQMGELGYVFAFLPPLLLILAAILEALITSAYTGPGKIATASLLMLTAMIAVFNLSMFLFFSPKLSAGSLAEHDRHLRSVMKMIRDDFDPRTSMIADAYDDMHVAYYLPQFRHVKIDPMVKESVRKQLPGGVRVVILMENYMSAKHGMESTGILFARGDELRYLIRNEDQWFININWQSHTVSLSSY